MSTRLLHISKELSLPRDAATSTIVCYGGKGMGKTNFASVLVEEFDATDIRFAVIDPMGVWWGLRHDATGKGRGIDVLILGGIHGDLPITPESGVLVADLVVDEDANVIIDISRRADGSMWTIGERIRFVTTYTKRVYQRQGEKRKPITQVIDEAARFAPQIVRQGESEVAACMGAIAVLVEEGRNVGIGVVLITQRSARLNKDVAELADCMIAFRIVGPNSMRAVLDWLGEHVEKARLKEIGDKLRSLPRGSALVVSPGWLEFEGIVAVRKRTTFDSSATPESGKQVRASGAGAKPDLDKYRVRLAELVEQQKANDPKQLKAEVARLKKANDILEAAAERAIKAQMSTAVSGGKAPKAVGREVVKASMLKRIEAAITSGDALITRWDDARTKSAEQADAEHKALLTVQAKADAHFQNLGKSLFDLGTVLRGVQHQDAATGGRAAPAPKKTIGSFPVEPQGSPRKAATLAMNGTSAYTEAPSPAKQRILDALAALENIAAVPADKTQLALFARQSPTSSGYTNNLGALRTAGLIEYPQPGAVQLTDSGRAIADGGRTPQSSADMHAYVRALIGDSRWKVLRPLIDAYPNKLAKDELAKQAAVSPTSSGYTNNLGSLRTLGLLNYPRPGEVVAADILFLGRAN